MHKLINNVSFILIGILISGVTVYASNILSGKDILFDNSSNGMSSTNIQDAIEELHNQANNLTGSCPSGFKCEAVCNNLTSTNVGDTVRYGSYDWKVIADGENDTTLILAGNLSTGAYSSGSTSFPGSTAFNNIGTLLNNNDTFKDKMDYGCLTSMGTYNGNDYYYRLPTSSELSSNTSNSSKTAFWTMSADSSNIYLGGSSGTLATSYTTSSVGTYYNAWGVNSPDNGSCTTNTFRRYPANNLITKQSIVPTASSVYTSYSSSSSSGYSTTGGWIRKGSYYCMGGTMEGPWTGNDGCGTTTCQTITIYSLGGAQNIGYRPVIKVKKV